MTRQELIEERIRNAARRLLKRAGARDAILALAHQIGQRYSGNPGAEEWLPIAEQLRRLVGAPSKHYHVAVYDQGQLMRKCGSPGCGRDLADLVHFRDTEITCVDCGEKFTDSPQGTAGKQWTAHRWNCPSPAA